MRKRNELGNEARATRSVGLASSPYLATLHFTSSCSCYGRGCNNIRTFHGSDYNILHREVLLWGSRAIYSKMFLRQRERQKKVRALKKTDGFNAHYSITHVAFYSTTQNPRQ